MAAPTLAAVMAALETLLDAVDGLRASDVTPDQVTVSGNASVAVVGVPDIPRYHLTMTGGLQHLTFTVTVLVSTQLDRVGQLRLAGFANPTGTTSIKAAIEANKTLGGIIDDLQVISFRPLGLQEVGEIGYYGGVFAVETFAS